MASDARRESTQERRREPSGSGPDAADPSGLSGLREQAREEVERRQEALAARERAAEQEDWDAAEAANDEENAAWDRLQVINEELHQKTARTVDPDTGEGRDGWPEELQVTGKVDNTGPFDWDPRRVLEAVHGIDTTELTDEEVGRQLEEMREREQQEAEEAYVREVVEESTGRSWDELTPDEREATLEEAAELEAVGGREGFEGLTDRKWDDLDQDGRREALDEAAELAAVGGREGFEGLTGRKWDDLDQDGRRDALDDAAARAGREQADGRAVGGADRGVEPAWTDAAAADAGASEVTDEAAARPAVRAAGTSSAAANSADSASESDAAAEATGASDAASGAAGTASDAAGASESGATGTEAQASSGSDAETSDGASSVLIAGEVQLSTGETVAVYAQPDGTLVTGDGREVSDPDGLLAAAFAEVNDGRSLDDYLDDVFGADRDDGGDDDGGDDDGGDDGEDEGGDDGGDEPAGEDATDPTAEDEEGAEEGEQDDDSTPDPLGRERIAPGALAAFLESPAGAQAKQDTERAIEMGRGGGLLPPAEGGGDPERWAGTPVAAQAEAETREAVEMARGGGVIDPVDEERKTGAGEVDEVRLPGGGVRDPVDGESPRPGEEPDLVGFGTGAGGPDRGTAPDRGALTAFDPDEDDPLTRDDAEAADADSVSATDAASLGHLAGHDATATAFQGAIEAVDADSLAEQIAERFDD